MSSEAILQAAAKLIAQVEKRLGSQVDSLQAAVDAVSGTIDGLKSDDDAHTETLRELEASTRELVTTVETALDSVKDGESVTVEDVRPLIEEVVAEAVKAIPAPQDGTSVTLEDVQPVIEEGIAQAVSGLPAPEPGQKGEDGQDGQDRPLVEPVALKSGREYPKNTVGTFAGGLWVSTKHAIDDPKGDPHAWTCILAGIESLHVELTGPRAYEFGVRLANGEVLSKDLRIPSPLHRGIYKEGETYLPGDIVTQGRSMFHCMAETDHAPPGNGWEQILAAPRGRKGDRGEDAKIPAEQQQVLEQLPDLVKELNSLKEFFTDLQEGLIEGGENG